MDLENTFIVASIGEQAEKDGLVKKSGEDVNVKRIVSRTL